MMASPGRLLRQPHHQPFGRQRLFAGGCGELGLAGRALRRPVARRDLGQRRLGALGERRTAQLLQERHQRLQGLLDVGAQARSRPGSSCPSPSRAGRPSPPSSSPAAARPRSTPTSSGRPSRRRTSGRSRRARGARIFWSRLSEPTKAGCSDGKCAPCTTVCCSTGAPRVSASAAASAKASDVAISWPARITGFLAPSRRLASCSSAASDGRTAVSTRVALGRDRAPPRCSGCRRAAR